MTTDKSPLIGLTVYASGDQFQYFPDDYINAVRACGAIPVLIPPCEPNYEKLVSLLDGIILTGGGDINPNLYSGESHSQLYWVNDDQDESEVKIARIALDLKKPILATCRGMQVINILKGGTLHVHLPDNYGEAVLHRLKTNQAVDHEVTIDENSNLAKLLGATQISVKSWHHQSIKDLASGFRAVGFAHDGVIEAIESDAYPSLIAVQWHPEIDNQDSCQQQKLFAGWLSKCL